MLLLRTRRVKKSYGKTKGLKAKPFNFGSVPGISPYLVFKIGEDNVAWMEDEDTERFAITILKALKSKHLK